MTALIRVLVVDDSALVRQILTRALSDDPQIEIVGTACDGVEALEKAGDLQPDVITLDIEMPELDGIQVLRHLHRRSDARVVVLSSVDDAATAYLALSLGAIDFVQKPAAGVATTIAELSFEMGVKIRTAFHVAPEHVAAIARAPIKITPSAAPQARPCSPESGAAPPGPLRVCVGLAASTGGPPALEAVFSGLSASLPAAFVVVQHLPAGFSTSLARRLSRHTGIEFVEAESGMVLTPGRGYIACHGAHLVVVTDDLGIHRFGMVLGSPVHGVRPAADPMLASLAEQFGAGSVGVVLTGMGSDGASGCAAILRAGGEVIVQDEETSVVWGMPRATQQLGVMQRAFPLSSIAEEIRRAVCERAREASG